MDKIAMEKDASRLDLSDTDRAEGEDIYVGSAGKELARGSPPLATPEPATTTSGAITTDTPAVFDPPPDGGFQAWLQVFGSAIVLVDTWGLINSYGVFQAHYESHILHDHSPSEISWIGSIQAALLCLVGVFSGPLFDAGYFRHMLFVGLFMIIFGMFMTSLCTLYWQFLLAQGFCIGIGMGLTFLPSAAILSQYFHRHRALAIGIASAGSPIAGIIFPIIFSRLEPVVGFAWATRVIAFILLALSTIPLACMRTRVPPTGRARAIIDVSSFSDWPYVTFVAASFFSFLTLYVPFFYMSVFATSHSIATAEFSPYLVTMLNVGSVFGRIIPNALADRWGSLNVIIVCALSSSILGFGWLGVHNLAGSIVFALLYGTLSGGVVGLMPSVIVSLAPDMGRVGVRMGMSFLSSGIALLIGTPIGGAIVGGYGDKNWKGMMVYAAASLFISAALYMVSRYLAFKRRGSWVL